ncbi:MAG: tryptophan synthase subunit alpha [Epsilonproteobacteria bacterium]|nr:tryptophan synthase subunit alpha [Campylobacterota bacterium]
MKELVVYITSSFPTPQFTEEVAFALKEAGADKLELGIPFSDPVADGPIIDRANQLALKRGFKIEELFKISSKVGSIIDTYWMGYFNPFYHKGLDLFIQKAKEYNIKGFIIPDLPFEEASFYKESIKKNNLDLIDFLAPTDSKKRVQLISKDAKGFLYLVAYAGITGKDKKEELGEIVAWAKEVSSTPIFIGFGVNPKNAKEKAKDVDGVIVGSAFIKVLLDESLSYSQKIKKISSIAKEIKEAINT